MNTYKIEHVSDFLKVPEDKLTQCLKEFHRSLEIARMLGEMAQRVDPAADMAVCMKSFDWIDDGKESQTGNVQCDYSPTRADSQ